MAVQPNIALALQPVDIATPVNAAADNALKDQMGGEQILKQHFENLDSREKSRLTSVVAGAAQLQPFLQNNDIEGAKNFLMTRKAQLQARVGQGEAIDTEDTDAALQMLESGQIDTLKNNVHGLLAVGQVYGLGSSKDLPSNIQEWQQYNAMAPEDQKRYLQMKRANQTLNLGGSQMVVGPGDATPVANYPVTPKPDEMPDFKRSQAQASAEGTAAGEANAGASNTVTKAAGLLSSLEDLKVSSANAPSGGIANAAVGGLNKAGIGGAAASAQGDFTVKRAAAENQIRQAFRVAGSGATSDRDAIPFIQMLPEATDSNDVKVAKVDAAMQAVKNTTRALAQARGLADPFAEGAGGVGATKVINGVTYIQQNGKWYQQ